MKFDSRLKLSLVFFTQEFDSSRDADDAIYDLNGKELGGERVTLEFSRSAGRGGGGRGFDRGPPPRRNDRFG